MPRPKSPPRVSRPYYHAGRDRWRIRIFDGGRQHDVWCSTRQEAEKAATAASENLLLPSRLLLDVLVEYFDEKQRHGIAKPKTCAEQLACLKRFFGTHLREELTKITPERAAAVYAAAVTHPSEKTGKPLEAASHRYYRDLAHGFYLWAKHKGYVSESPFRSVRPVGRPSAGKPQLTLDEARLYRDTALRLYDERADVLALAAVVPLYLGLRVSEVLSRRVRDLDCDGTMLRISAGKTKNARRYLAIRAPALRARLVKLASGRAPDALLFSLRASSEPHSRQTLHAAVQRVCRAAGVPVVCPHSLRGLWATLGVESGAAEAAVAAALGHGSFAVTARHYAQPEALSDTRSARVAGLLDAPVSSGSLITLPAEQLITRLPETTLAKLALLLAGKRRNPIVA